MTLPDDLRMRPAHPQDLDDVMWLERTSFPTDAWSSSQMAGELHSPYGHYVVVETIGDARGAGDGAGAGDDDRAGGRGGDGDGAASAHDGDPAAPTVVGYAGLSSLPGDPVADVQTIAVAAARRGQGIGRALFGELLAEARRRAVREVFLEVRADNPVAQAMYAGFGFEHIATRPRYYQPDDVDAWVMRLTLPDAPGTADATHPTDTAGTADAGSNSPGPIGREALS